jgi:hypothetical protein
MSNSSNYALKIKVLQLNNKAQILDYEKDLLSSQIQDEVDRELFSWKAPWREESLDHYLPLGWSFLAWEGEEGRSQISGYFLAQPILFFGGFTQNLWLEHFQTPNLNVKNELLDVAYKTCREKHFQKLIFSNNIDLTGTPFESQVQVHNGLRTLSTSKIRD